MVNPLIQTTVQPAQPRGDEVHAPLNRNPYLGTENAPEFENGYEHAQSLGHLTLSQSNAQQWAGQNPAWRAGFATAASRLGQERLSQELMAKSAAVDPAELISLRRKQLITSTILGAGGAALGGYTGGLLDPAYGSLVGAAAGSTLGQYAANQHVVPDDLTRRKNVDEPTLSHLLLGAPKEAAMTALPHQERVADKLSDPDTKGLIADHGLGSGKTFTSIHSATKLKLPILAIVPAPLRNNYKKELAAAGFPHESRVMSYTEALNKANDPELKDYASKSLVTYDEGHRMGQQTSARSKLPQMLPGKKTLILTGTPIRNNPEELIPLVNGVSPGSLPNSPEEFRSKFLHHREVPVGFWGRIMGQESGTEKVPVNLHEFQKAVHGKVDFYQSADRSTFPSHDEKIMEVPMSDKQQAAYDFVMGRYPTMAYKVKHGLPPTKSEQSNFQSFLIGPRQISNHPGAFNQKATDEDAPKIKKMADELEKRYVGDKNFRGVVYSNFLDSGIHPISRELKRRGIAHHIFTGDINDKKRKAMVEDYNAGKVPVLMISGAGAEGLDLKGTKLMQVMEPHWQEELIGQVKGRAVRYKSHSHLPEHERHVEIQRYHSVPQVKLWDKLVGRTRSGEKSVDEYMYETAKKKQGVNKNFLDVMRGIPPGNPEKTSEAQTGKWAFYEPQDNQRFPGILVDLDGTIVETPGQGMPFDCGQQQVMPNRIEVLTALKQKGYKIVGVTNRGVYGRFPEGFDVDLLQAGIEETLSMFEGLLDDVIYIPFESQHHKPAPTMLLYAMEKYGLDKNNTVMVGNSQADKGAADAAGIPFFEAEMFFTADMSQAPEAKAAEWTDPQNMLDHVRKHSNEFGGPETYLNFERHLSMHPPADMTPMNRRCETVFMPGGHEATRCATGYHSLEHGIMHVRDDHTGHTVTLYRRLNPKNFPKLNMR